MGVYIDMEMPTSCGDCRFCGGIADTDCGPCARCDVDGKARVADTRQDCPLVPVPPHGRTIDAAALWVEINKICDRRDAGIITDLTCVQQLLSAVRHAPTIIPAEPLNEEVNE